MEFSTFLIIFGAVLVIIIIVAIINANKKEEERLHKKRMSNIFLNNLENFKATNRLVGSWGLIAIDDVSKQIAIKKDTGKIKKYQYSEILSCEVIEDGITTYKKTNTIGRAIVGGIIAGGAGAIIGGLSGESKKKTKIKTLEFKILFKDINNPSFKIKFFDAWEESGKTESSIDITNSVYSHIYKKSVNNLEHWKNIIGVIINNNAENQNLNTQNLSVSDELIKLNNLKESGIITEEEFIKQKNKILE
jgi:Short C-terminal domain